MNIYRALLYGLVAIILICAGYTPFCLIFKINQSEKAIVLRNVLRVFMHEKGHYTIWWKENPKDEVIREYDVVLAVPPQVYEDVGPDEFSWIRFREVYFAGIQRQTKELEFHLHSVSEINGGGWQKREGQFIRTGQTTVVE